MEDGHNVRQILHAIISLTLIQHITPKQTLIEYIILGDNIRMELNDKIGPATVMHVTENKFSIQHITPKWTFIKYIILSDNSRKEFKYKIGPADRM